MQFTPPDTFNTPVLLLIFNRPEPTRVLLQILKSVKPPKLYVAADGPRSGIISDVINCDEARQVVSEEVDWKCDLKTSYSKDNLGCGRGPVRGISWFFNHEQEGIILEDDCVPTMSFFWYCQELLNRYRYDTRIMHIGGNNFHDDNDPRDGASYYFSNYGHVWGWATWARAWREHDLKLSKLNYFNRLGLFKSFFINGFEKMYRLRKLRSAQRNHQHIWDYQWDFARYINSGLAIVPSKNLVGNIGFGSDATHTTQIDHENAGMEVQELDFPLRHPSHVIRDFDSDRKYTRRFLRQRLLSKLPLKTLILKNSLIKK